jgi:hypothetical protein
MDTVDNIISKSPEVVIGLGDDAYEPDVDCWFDIVEPIDDIMKNVIGNHEIEIGIWMRFWNTTTTITNLSNTTPLVMRMFE